jgi:UDP-glucose 4-epimerase
MKVLITGGAGFIGSTIASACLDNGITPVILDNLATGRREFTEDREFYHGDIADGDLIDRIFGDHPEIGTVIHCAALIVVPESVAQPLRYYRENVAKTVDLLQHVLRNGSEQILFSSSASIYAPVGGDVVVDETSAIAPSSPYARTKAMMEQVLQDTAASSALRVISLRYFNPIGADPQLRTGLQLLAPSHALGKLIEAYASKDTFRITGVNWPTRDGSGIRDYIHVWDLALAHIAALKRFQEVVPPGRGTSYQAINVGTGTGTTVRELLRAFEEVVGERLEVAETDPRPGDVNGCYTANANAGRLLCWRPERSLKDGISDSLAWREKWVQRVQPELGTGASAEAG